MDFPKMSQDMQRFRLCVYAWAALSAVGLAMKVQLRNHFWFSRMVFALSLAVPFLMTACGGRGAATSAVKKRKPLGSFTAVSNMTTARAGHTATLLHNGKVLIAGGFDDNSKILASAELYDPSTGTFTTTGSMTTPRAFPSATLLADGRVLIAGGIQGLDPGTPVFSAEIYDPSTGAFTTTGDLMSLSGNSVESGSTALLPDGRIFVAAPDNAEIYNPQSGTFTFTGPYADLSPIIVNTVTSLTNGKVLVTGWPSQIPSGMTELFDPKSGTFGVTGQMVGKHFWEDADSATLLAGGRVLFVGTYKWYTIEYFKADAEVYDPVGGKFVSSGSANDPHYGAPAVRLSDGSVLIPGGAAGFTDAGVSEGGANAELYVPATGTFRSAGEMTVSRSGHTATLLPDGTVLITGGVSVWPIPVSSAEVYTPASSGASAASTSP